MGKKAKDNSTTRSLLTTGDIARYCETTVKQVNRWIQKGDLEAFRTPGGHYRIAKEKFREFLERNGMPVNEEFFKAPHNMKVLVVDDDSKLVNVIGDVLKTRYEDWEIEKAHDGYEALITVGNFNPDLLILDIRMPKVDGLDVCRRLRENKVISSRLKILAMTAHSEAYDRETVLAAGADEYLLKPIGMKTLLEYVEKLI